MLLPQSPAATHQQRPTSSFSRRTCRSAQPCPRRAGAAPATAAAEAPLPGGLRAESLPRHVAVVMDGNSRWARARGMPSAFGHEAGRRALEETVRLSRAWGIRALTAFAFSHENWSRPKVRTPGAQTPSSWLPLSSLRSPRGTPELDCSWDLQVEVDFLMGLFERVIHDSVSEFLRYTCLLQNNRLTLRSDCCHSDKMRSRLQQFSSLHVDRRLP